MNFCQRWTVFGNIEGPDSNGEAMSEFIDNFGNPLTQSVCPSLLYGMAGSKTRCWDVEYAW